MALLADAWQSLSDVLWLVIAWIAYGLSRLRPTPRFTYGLRGSSILAALFNAIFLLLAAGAIALAAIERLGDPQSLDGGTMVAVAGIGIVVHGFTAWVFMIVKQHHLNHLGSSLHVAADSADPKRLVHVIRMSGIVSVGGDRMFKKKKKL